MLVITRSLNGKEKLLIRCPDGTEIVLHPVERRGKDAWCVGIEAPREYRVERIDLRDKEIKR